MQKQASPSPHHTVSRVAIIAGTGSLPLEACRSLEHAGTPFFVLSLFPEDNGTALAEHAPLVIQESIYKISAILRLLKHHNTSHVLFVGKVDKRHLLKKLSFDWLLTKLLAKAAFKNDSDVMELLIGELARHDIATLSQRATLQGLFVPPGVLTGSLSPQIKVDSTLGMRVAQELSRVDIGQTVVVKKGMVLAVEAIEGTDECIARGISLGGRDVVVCKTARVTQSDQFDIPTLGPATIAALPPGQVSALVWQSKRTMIADQEELVRLAQEKGIALISLAETCD